MGDFNLVGRIRPVYRGVWDSGTNYTVLEVVVSDDMLTAYIAIKDVPAGTALSNSEYWGAMVSAKELKAPSGEDGGYYVPAVSSDGVLTWAASKNGMPSVASVNVIGPRGKDGVDGKDGGYIIPNVHEAGDYITFSFTPSDPDMDVIIMDKMIKLPVGPQGPTGPVGPTGVGIDAIEAYESSVSGGMNRVEITLTDGESYRINVRNGKDGQNGSDGAAGPAGPEGPAGPAGKDGKDGAVGQDGVSPKVELEEITGGHRVVIKDMNGSHAFDVMNGAAGPAGEKGEPGPAGVDGAQGPKGDKGDTGATGATGSQGPKGDTGPTGPAGKTPVKGTDYWTTADRQQMVADVLAALPVAEEASF